MRVLIALGGNAMISPGGSATMEAQAQAIELAMDAVADLIGQGHDIVLTHGNGPQVGNLLVKNELAAGAVPPVTLDWCGAQTQGTVGFTILNALERRLRRIGSDKRVAALVTRTVVDADDPNFNKPSKPVGRFLTYEEAAPLIDAGQTWEDRGALGWRRVVASPEPVEILDQPAVNALVDAGFVVVAAGGGGIPVVRLGPGESDGHAGREAVIDKDLSSALLARAVRADVLIVATDVDHANTGFGTSQATPIGRVTPTDLREIANRGEFARGSMEPKVEAALRFVEAGGRRAVITSLTHIAQAVTGMFGTVVENLNATPNTEG